MKPQRNPRLPLVLSLAAVALLGAQASPSKPPPPPIPTRVQSSVVPTYSHWISASAAVNQSGAMDWSVLSAHGVWLREFSKKRALQELAGINVADAVIALLPAGSCMEFVSAAPPGRQNPSSTLADFRKYAANIIEGEVTATDVGFFNENPSAMLRVRPTRWLKPRDLGITAREVLVPYASAHFRIGRDVFCGGGPYDPTAVVGARVLLFVYPEAYQFPGGILDVAPAELVLSNDGVEVHFDDGLKRDPGLEGIKEFGEFLKLLEAGQRTP